MRALFESILSQPVIVPSIWILEMCNVLVMSEKAGTLKIPLAKAVSALWNFPVAIDETIPERAWAAVVKLAQRHGLSTYDASYLELAQRKRALLATLDDALARAAKAEGVLVLPN